MKLLHVTFTKMFVFYGYINFYSMYTQLMYAAVDVQGMRQGSAQGQQPPTGVLYSDIQYP